MLIDDELHRFLVAQGMVRTVPEENPARMVEIIAKIVQHAIFLAIERDRENRQ